MELAFPGYDHPLTVVEVSRAVRELLEGVFSRVSVQGEVTGFKRSANGHIYFALTEADPSGGTARLDCVVWRSSRIAAKLDLSDGESVIATGRMSAWSGSSRYQLVVEKVELAGRGDLLRRLEETRRRLLQEGLFDPSRKRTLPYLPRRIGVVTSVHGAAVRDIVRTILGRWPAQILVADARVQGEGAAAEVAAGIEALNRIPDIDVIIIGRGGGALEDLFAFNEEVLVRAVAASRVPVVSAVGHEVDHVLTDDAADARAPTPTAAGNLVVPSMVEVAQLLDALADRMSAALSRRVEAGFQRLDDLHARLSGAGKQALGGHRHRLEMLQARLRAAHPMRRLEEARRTEEALRARLMVVGRRLLERPRALLGQMELKLSALSPHAPLERGYALALTRDGRIIRRHDEVARGDQIDVLLGAGSLACDVTDTRP